MTETEELLDFDEVSRGSLAFPPQNEMKAVVGNLRASSNEYTDQLPKKNPTARSSLMTAK